MISQKIYLESPIVTNARHFEALQKASDSLNDVLRGLETGVTSDFVAMDIRRGLAFFGGDIGGGFDGGFTGYYIFEVLYWEVTV